MNCSSASVKEVSDIFFYPYQKIYILFLSNLSVHHSTHPLSIQNPLSWINIDDNLGRFAWTKIPYDRLIYLTSYRCEIVSKLTEKWLIGKYISDTLKIVSYDPVLVKVLLDYFGEFLKKITHSLVFRSYFIKRHPPILRKIQFLGVSLLFTLDGSGARDGLDIRRNTPCLPEMRDILVRPLCDDALEASRYTAVLVIRYLSSYKRLPTCLLYTSPSPRD